MNGHMTNTERLLTEEQIRKFVMRNFREARAAATIQELVHFHTVNKFLLMAHSYDDTKVLGRLVANKSNLSLHLLLGMYEKQLESTLRKRPTNMSHSNVLQKIFGYFKKDLLPDEKSTILRMISDYKNGLEPLEHIILSLETLTRRIHKSYLVRQTYFLLYYPGKPRESLNR